MSGALDAARKAQAEQRAAEAALVRLSCPSCGTWVDAPPGSNGYCGTCARALKRMDP